MLMKDYASWYERISAPFRSQTARTTINYVDKVLVWLFVAFFLIGIGVLIVNLDMRAIRFVAVPAVVFAVVTIARIAINEPRPYEAFDIDPIIHKDTQGKSMPSRHMASAVVISCAIAWLSTGFGVAAFCCCAAIAFTRIVGGVHYPRDIVAAVAIAAIFGIVGFFVIP